MVVLVDAVDEAADPYQLIVELLEPVASAAGRTKVRLLVGTRPGGENGLLRLLGASAVIVDLDSPANLDARDIGLYGPGSPPDFRQRKPRRSDPVRAGSPRRPLGWCSCG